MSHRPDLEEFLAGLVNTGLVTAASAVVETGSGQVTKACAGWRDPEGRREPTETDSLFDLASLTKSLTGTLALVLDQEGALPLATRLEEIWPAASAALGDRTLDDLLRHRAGLRRWMPLYRVCDEPGQIAEHLLGGDWVDSAGEVYSDLDYILWGLSVERTLARSYAELVGERVLDRLGRSQFAVPPVAGSRAVGCTLPTGREVELAATVGLEIDELPPPARGTPQDGNTRFIGRSLGHAGLFGTATGVAALAREYLRPGELLGAASVAAAGPRTGRFGVGWFGRSETAAGRLLSAGALGHEGFTGGSVWVEPSSGRLAVLLAHRTSLEVDLTAARCRFHELVFGR